MGAKSSIEKLGVQELVGHLFETPGVTLEDIVAKVREATGKTVSKSALSRYRTTWSDAQQQLALAQQDAEAIMVALRAKPDLNFTETAMSMLLSKLVRRFANAQESFENVPLDKLSSLLVKVSRAQTESQTLELQRERLELLKRNVATAAADVKERVRSAGLSEEQVREIEEKILGLVPA